MANDDKGMADMTLDLMTYVYYFVVIVIAVAVVYEVWRRVCQEDDEND